MIITICHNCLPQSRRVSHVKSVYTSTFSPHSPLAYILIACVLCSAVETLLHFLPTVSWNALRPCTRSKARQEPSKMVVSNFDHLHLHRGSPLFSIVLSLPRSLHCHSTATESKLHTISVNPNLSLLNTRPPLASAIDTLPAYLVLIHFFHVSKLSQHSQIHSTGQLNIRFQSLCPTTPAPLSASISCYMQPGS